MNFRSELDIQLFDIMLNKKMSADQKVPNNIFLYKIKSFKEKDESFMNVDSLKRGSEDIVDDIKNVYNSIFN
jgi:hypothetical protein